jgi:hypothetical protein
MDPETSSGGRFNVASSHAKSPSGLIGGSKIFIEKIKLIEFTKIGILFFA